MNRIDIIIPAYNAHDTIDKTLQSIANQTIINLLDITIVNDCSDYDYSEFVNKYSNIINIREIKTNFNIGSGGARSFGIDNTNNPLITFIDADDEYTSIGSLAVLLQEYELNSNTSVVIANFLQEMYNKTIVEIKNDYISDCAKLYSRSFLNKYNIRHTIGIVYLENFLFNFKILLHYNSNNNIINLDKAIYKYNFNSNSSRKIIKQPELLFDSYKKIINEIIHLLQEIPKEDKKYKYFGSIIMILMFIYYDKYLEFELGNINVNNLFYLYYSSIFANINVSDSYLKKIYNKLSKLFKMDKSFNEFNIFIYRIKTHN